MVRGRVGEWGKLTVRVHKITTLLFLLLIHAISHHFFTPLILGRDTETKGQSGEVDGGGGRVR
jgi:hypothetical protein